MPLKHLFSWKAILLTFRTSLLSFNCPLPPLHYSIFVSDLFADALESLSLSHVQTKGFLPVRWGGWEISPRTVLFLFFLKGMGRKSLGNMKVRISSCNCTLNMLNLWDETKKHLYFISPSPFEVAVAIGWKWQDPRLSTLSHMPVRAQLLQWAIPGGKQNSKRGFALCFFLLSLLR